MFCLFHHLFSSDLFQIVELISVLVVFYWVVGTSHQVNNSKIALNKAKFSENEYIDIWVFDSIY